VTQWLQRRRRGYGGQQGFTLIELLIVVAIIGILASIGLSLYTNIQARARLAKAQADTRAIASAVSMYGAHLGFLATAMGQLTATISNAQSLTAGPFLLNVPQQPAGWAAYGLTGDIGAGTFQITATGDNTGVTVP
jgi:prepilin-type N-terminal cleavage/methylation domain-containing protein